MMHTLGEFFKRIDDDSQFREEFFKAVPHELTSLAPIMEFARANGFDFTAQELEQTAAAAFGSSELTDAQLEAVSGGTLPAYADPGSLQLLRSFAGLNLDISAECFRR